MKGVIAQLGARPNRLHTPHVKGGESFRNANGAIAQLGERLNGIQEVRSSTLLGSTRKR